MACEAEQAAVNTIQAKIAALRAEQAAAPKQEQGGYTARLNQLGAQAFALGQTLAACRAAQPPAPGPLVLPHLMEISRVDGTPWVNPPFNTSAPNWSSNVVGGKTFDGSKDHPFEWVSVLNPKVEQDDEVGVAGTAILVDDSGADRPADDWYLADVPFTHPFKADFEFTLVPDAPYLPLLAPANRDRNGVFKDSWPAANHLLGADPAGVLALEVDGALVPTEDRVQPADRVALYGRWIVDAGHPEFHTEIHPPLLMAHARCVNAVGAPTPPTLDAVTHVQFWSRPYQAAQLFKNDGDSGIVLADYIERIASTIIHDIDAYPVLHDKAFAGTHLVAFTVRAPAQPPRSNPAAVPAWQLMCSYHFTVNGSCGVEVIPSPADPNAALVVLALNAAGYPTLPEPPSDNVNVSLGKLLNASGTSVSWYAAIGISILKRIHNDHIVFRIYRPPATSAQDSAAVVPFTPLHTLPASSHATDPHSPFPVRGWLKLAWAPVPHTNG